MSEVLRKLFVAGSGVAALVFLLLAAGVSRAEDEAKTGSEGRIVYATVWGQTLAQDGTGFYNQIADSLLVQEKAGISYQLMPYKRARATFLAGKTGCLYPSSISVLSAGGFAPEPEAFIQTHALFHARTHLFARKGATPPASLDDIKGKSVALPSGSVMFSLLAGSGANLITVNDETDKAQMLITGRVDLMSGMMPDTSIVFNDLGSALPAYDQKLAFLDVGVALVCYSSPENQAFVDRLNGQIETLNTDTGYVSRLMQAGVMPDVVAASALDAISPAAGGSEPVPTHPGRRLPFGNIR